MVPRQASIPQQVVGVISGEYILSPEDLPEPEIKTTPRAAPALQDSEPLGKSQVDI